MSSGSNLTSRQRRGKTIIQPGVLKPPGFTIQNEDPAADTLQFQFDVDVSYSVNPADYSDWISQGSDVGHITTVTPNGPRLFTVHFNEDIEAGDTIESTGVKSPVRATSGEPVGAFRVTIGGSVFWPPHTP